MKSCETQYKPICYLMIFCCRTCYEKSGLKEFWESLWLAFADSPEKLARKRRKKKYLQTEKGKEQHRRESRRRYQRQKEERQRLQDEARRAAVPPDASSDIPELPLKTQETDELKSLQETSGSSPPAESSSGDGKKELLQTGHQRILNTLFSGNAKVKIATPDRISPPTEIVARQCKRPGCDEIVIPRSSETSKKFCSKNCVDALRNGLQTIRLAFKRIRCPGLRLLMTLLKML